MDPDDWEQPHQFRPERFLDESGNVINRDRVIPFGLGRLIFTWRCNYSAKAGGGGVMSSFVLSVIHSVCEQDNSRTRYGCRPNMVRSDPLEVVKFWR